MPHDHGHHHGHHHHHHHHGGNSKEARRRLFFAFILNFGFGLIELIGGFYTNSVAVMSDALHDLGDSAALGIAFFLEKKSEKQGDLKYSYGYRRWSIFSALITGIILIVGSLVIVKECIPRLFNPEMPKLGPMLGLAVLGVLVNGVAAWRLSKGSSLNEKMIRWHLLEDLLGWILVLVGALLMWWGAWPIIDPLLGLGLAAWIIRNVWRNLGETIHVFLQGTPLNLNVQDLQNDIHQFVEVESSHHTHIWSIDGEKHVLTSHIVVKSNVSATSVASLKSKIKQLLLNKYKISEATLEIEWSQEDCVDPHHH